MAFWPNPFKGKHLIKVYNYYNAADGQYQSAPKRGYT
jgi:hypothetical protein